MSAGRISGEPRSGLRLEGTLRAADAAALFDGLPVADGPVRLDLSDVEAVDSAGLALLLEWQQRLEQSGGALVIVAPPEALVRLARISGVDTLLTMQTKDAGMTEE